MKNIWEIVWIDDTPERADYFQGGLSTTLAGVQVEAKLEVIAVTENFLQTLDKKVEAWLSNPPDLIMLDHSLTKVHRRLFGMHGSALAHLLRIQLPKIPIVCASGQTLASDQFNSEDISEYTYIFDVNRIHEDENLELLFSIANDFKYLCFEDHKPVRRALVEALKTPELDSAALLSILPEEFEGVFVHGSSPHRIAHWVLNVFLQRPGFLYDSLEAATFLGLRESSFIQKVKANFESARYRGPFATEARPLWWASQLTDVLYEILPNDVSMQSQGTGRRLPSITEDDFSMCGVSQKSSPAPDVVAYGDVTKSKRLAVNHIYTVPLSDQVSSVLGFSALLRIRNDRREV